ncbi:hypothetical protein P3W45_001659 [Vairimorpha bombi]|jgi:deoxyribodipyrimidine photo-lyase
MKNRTEVLCNNPVQGNVLYICIRDLRIQNNHSINYAYNLSYHFLTEFFVGIPLSNIKCNDVQYSFMLESIEEMYKDADKYKLNVSILDDLSEYISINKITNIVLDWSPLREYLDYYRKVTGMCKKRGIFCVQIDSHNVVPCKIFDVYKRTSSSVKMLLFKKFFEYLDEEYEVVESVDDANFIKNDVKYIVNVWDDLEVHKYNKKKNSPLNIPEYEKCKYFRGGFKAGNDTFNKFTLEKLKKYGELRNCPDVDGLSNLSPYLHFGIISPQKIIQEAYEKFYKTDKANLEIFVAEIFIWRETAEHFCYHNKNYDNIMGALEWARESLQSHTNDKREHLYTYKELEEGKTADKLWNAAQKQLIFFNKIHGYVRMYWAKQLVKWTKSPEEAIKIGIVLNDKYSIDGNDPNGYLGVMWSICGSMDRGYKDRPITGKIRPMNAIKTKWYARMWNNKEERTKYLKDREIKRKF